MLTILATLAKSFDQSALAGGRRLCVGYIVERGIQNISFKVWVRPQSDMRGRMKRFRLGRQNPRASRVAFGVAAAGVALALAACSSSTSTSGSTPQGGSSASGSASNAKLSALSDAVNKAAAEPSFNDYAAYFFNEMATT